MGVHEILTALSDKTRRNILMILKEGKISSGELAERLGMSPPALSYHLAKLKKADIIYETKFKNYVYYELNLSVIEEVIVWMNMLKEGEHEKD